MGGVRVQVPEYCCQLLARFDRPTSVGDAVAAVPRAERRLVRDAIDRLHRVGLLIPALGGDDPAGGWATWGLPATWFHFSTRDLTPLSPRSRQAFNAANAARPAPSSALAGTTSRRIDSGTLALPARRDRSAFARVVASRRTWRDFGTAPVTSEQLGTLLDLTFGYRAQAVTTHGGTVMLGTSPSPGATHSIAVYVVALKVQGLSAGTYWYDRSEHGLRPLRGSTPTPALVGRWLNDQWWFEGTGVLVFTTGILARIQHRYDYARAYRAWLLEAGHLCQTFCLSATWLGLAPFCTQFIADSRVERHLGLKAREEPVLYAMGAGSRPPGVTRAPWPRAHADGNPYGRPREIDRGPQRRRRASVPPDFDC